MSYLPTPPRPPRQAPPLPPQAQRHGPAHQTPPAPTLPPTEREPASPEARKLAALAYLSLVPPLWPAAPLVWALKGKEHPLVRWHAARATLLVGAFFLFVSTVAPVLYVLVAYVGLFLMMLLGDRESLRLMPLVTIGSLVLPSTLVQFVLLTHAPFAAAMAHRGEIVREGLVARGTAWLVKSKPFD